MKKPVFIIAGGESLAGFDFNKLQFQDVIAVNKSIFSVPWAKYFITMDYTFIDKKVDKELFKKLICKKYFVVATNNSFIRFQNNNYIDTRFKYVYDLSLFDQIIPSLRGGGLGRTFKNFVHGCNSGWCALQLAIVLGYTQIYLLGMDMKAEYNTHFHGGYATKLSTFQRRLRFYEPIVFNGLKLCKSCLPHIKIYSCAEHSSLNKIIPYVSLTDLPIGEIH